MILYFQKFLYTAFMCKMDFFYLLRTDLDVQRFQFQVRISLLDI